MALADELSAALLTSSGDAIIAADERGLIQFWNPGAERMFGFPAADPTRRVPLIHSSMCPSACAIEHGSARRQD
jgi:PAS domain-containing protein